MIRKVLIANRGEIAVRIIRTLKEMGIASVAVYSDADAQALFTQEADESYRLGPPPAAESYLNIPSILSIAHQAHADAVHPGYGFLAENANFAQSVQEAGLTFIGPPLRAIRLMGDKVAARRAVAELGVPLVPGSPGPVSSVGDALIFADTHGYPVAVKAAGGGGGRGIRIVNRPEDMADALERASREAQAYFKNPDVYIERYFSRPRHVEIQVLGDSHGNLIHLGERDCSVQRKHQKLIEETPSPAVSKNLRQRMGDMALRAAQSAGYTNAGTVEFLLSDTGEFYFLEMNTRIQVEHPVTEQVTGVDLIREMVLAAAGERITVSSNRLELTGHSIEVRINAEDPSHDFMPTPAAIARYREPAGIGVRMDSGVYEGYTIPAHYDSLLSKVITWAPNREQARLRALRALDEFRIAGPCTTIPFARAILTHPNFVCGEVWTTFVTDHRDDLSVAAPHTSAIQRVSPTLASDGFRTFDVEVNRKRFEVRIAERDAKGHDRIRRRPRVHRGSTTRGGTLISPMHGVVLSIRKTQGETVEPGETVLVIEAMKMENEIAAEIGGTVRELHVSSGETVESGQALVDIE